MRRRKGIPEFCFRGAQILGFGQDVRTVALLF